MVDIVQGRRPGGTAGLAVLCALTLAALAALAVAPATAPPPDWRDAAGRCWHAPP